jgi:glycosyltransferase involved in cell wall biosynthesis
MKTRHLSRIPSVGADRLQRELHEVGGSLIDLELSPEGMASLITCSDVYISLHRSEGFGLGIAEAMLLGRPAIATAYSGNMDFMTQYNSCLVGYGIHPVDEFELSYNPGMELVYEPGQLWAEPNVDHATRWMRWLYENPEQRQQIGAAGSATIRAQYSPAAAAAAAAARLEQIAADAPHRAARQAVAAAHRAQIAAEAASRAGARRARQSA